MREWTWTGWRNAVLAAAALAVSGCTGVPEGVAPVTGFDPTRFSGTWYEIMRLDHTFESGLTNVRATYQPRPDGTVAVFNRAWNPTACAWETVEGSARLRAGPDVGSFAVTLTSPFPGGLHVLALDHADYQWALAGGPTRDFLWILSRTPTLDPEIRKALMRQARDMGYPVADLVRVDQSGPVCESR
ncbi:lipocalin [Roseospira marina]|uniref:Outer membrane lipoprotein Blc n=1 Tax=Roseospira marina TaxID=140057 RepID=A0A5M6IEL5_9PROT|nr:lipocalin family protein [Roseospira marina]KAA5606713.1 lipocalin [Roseospira marina]MBB4313872.1 apolipoprotein D and lipocalin family protein [Roseospira marina]MBB5087034.1 apolipoprotein D and lipocalin family protein [Roseospira marina]